MCMETCLIWGSARVLEAQEASGWALIWGLSTEPTALIKARGLVMQTEVSVWTWRTLRSELRVLIHSQDFSLVTLNGAVWEWSRLWTSTELSCLRLDAMNVFMSVIQWIQAERSPFRLHRLWLSLSIWAWGQKTQLRGLHAQDKTHCRTTLARNLRNRLSWGSLIREAQLRASIRN